MDNKNLKCHIYIYDLPLLRDGKIFKSRVLSMRKNTTDPENRKKLVSMGIRGVPTIFVGENIL